MRDLRELDRYRDYLTEMKLFGSTNDEQRRLGGCFIIPTKGVRRGLKVIASSGEIALSQGWDHVSVSLPTRCPTWEEMCKIKDLFFDPKDVCFQLHPAQSDNVSNHAYCLHIWRNIHQSIPLPPASMVGDKSLGTRKEGDISIEEIRKYQDASIADLTKRTSQ